MATEGRIRVIGGGRIIRMMRNGLRETLEASGRFEVVGQAEDGEEAVRTVEEIDPQVIVMDVIMPNRDGVDACRDIMELLPETRVLMLTASTEEDAVIEAVAAGATGYLQKYSRPEELVEAVLDVAEGRLRIPDKVVREVFAIVRGDRKFAARLASARLTALERGDPDAVRRRLVVRRDRRGEGQQHRDRPQYPLPHTGEARHREETGARDSGPCGTAWWTTWSWAMTPRRNRKGNDLRPTTTSGRGPKKPGDLAVVPVRGLRRPPRPNHAAVH